MPRGTTGELLIPIEEEFECYGNTKQTQESCMVEPSFFPKTSEPGYKRLFYKTEQLAYYSSKLKTIELAGSKYDKLRVSGSPISSLFVHFDDNR